MENTKPKKIILDTDLGGDCDDAGAIAVLANLAKKGLAEILAVTYCIGNPWGCYFVKDELRYFGFERVPVGCLKDKGFMDAEGYARYTKPYCEKMNVAPTETEDAVKVLRRTLAENGGAKDITLAAIGPLRNIANLLSSGADEISPLTGKELIEANVSEFVTMLGSFTEDKVEWNVLMDVPSARKCVAEMPVPVTFLPHEAGIGIVSGYSLENVPETHPVRFAYTVYSGYRNHLRFSWDPITVYCAVTGGAPLWERRPVTVNVREDGRFEWHEGGSMTDLVQVGTNEEVIALIDPLYM